MTFPATVNETSLTFTPLSSLVVSNLICAAHWWEILCHCLTLHLPDKWRCTLFHMPDVGPYIFFERVSNSFLVPSFGWVFIVLFIILLLLSSVNTFYILVIGSTPDDGNLGCAYVHPYLLPAGVSVNGSSCFFRQCISLLLSLQGVVWRWWGQG